MIKENEAFLASVHAEQIVLVGDQKQLGPAYSFRVDGPTSLYDRLTQAGHPYDFLDTQYRMHRSLMEVPNMLFYKDRIKCGYVKNIEKQFLYSQSPFLFVDVPNGREIRKETSYWNESEADATEAIYKHCIQLFSQTLQLNAENERIPIQKFTKNSVYVITPYNAQKNAISERFLESETDDQVLSIDSSQGREFDLVFVSMVRTSPGSFV